MISMDELLMGRAKLEDLPETIQNNLKDLHKKINIIRTAYGKPMKVNDGLRFAKDTPKNGSKTSKHLQGAAVDIDDDDKGTFWNWCLANLELIAKTGLYLEDPRWTHGNGSWIHFQVIAPGSGKRIFVPSTAPAPAPKLWDGKYDSDLDS